MIDQLKSLVKEYGADAIITNPAIPNERNDEAVDIASNSIFGGLQNAATSGNTGDLMNIFKGDPAMIADSPVTQNIKGNFVENLVKKFGLDHGKAGQIATSLIPMILSKFANKTNDPNDNSFDLSDILGKLSGGGGIGDLLGKGSGGDDKGGGLMDKVKGMFN